MVNGQWAMVNGQWRMVNSGAIDGVEIYPKKETDSHYYG